jgi:hypothetical protein
VDDCANINECIDRTGRAPFIGALGGADSLNGSGAIDPVDRGGGSIGSKLHGALLIQRTASGQARKWRITKPTVGVISFEGKTG